MFEQNDYVIYGRQGVCVIEDITTLKNDALDKNKEYYVLQPLNSKASKIYTPVNNEKVSMRKIVTKEEAMELINDIPNIGTIWVENEKLREQKYKETMDKHDCREWVKILKTLYLRKQMRQSEGKKMTNTDERYLKAAEDCLYGEMSITLDIPKDKVEDYITARVGTIDSR